MSHAEPTRASPADQVDQSTAQITRAMQMVAASKMRKAQQAALAMRPFARELYQIQRRATSRAAEFKHPLLEVRDVRKRAVILVAADKGLCGALNTNIFRVASTVRSRLDGVHHGRTQGGAVRRAHASAQLIAEFPYGDTPRYGESRAIAALARDIFLKGDVDEVKIVATRFVNTMTQQAVTMELLPIGAITSVAVPGAGPTKRTWPPTPGAACSSRVPARCSAICCRTISISSCTSCS